MKNSNSLPSEVLSEANKNKVVQALLDYIKKESDYLLVRMGIITDTKETDAIAFQIMGWTSNVHEEFASRYQWLLQCLEKRKIVLKEEMHWLLQDYDKKDMIL